MRLIFGLRNSELHLDLLLSGGCLWHVQGWCPSKKSNDADIAINASQDGGLKLDLMRFASFFAGFIFLYAAFFGKYSWDVSKADDTGE